jgi:nitronate monooxygenase
MWSRNAFTERLKLKWPILQAPMGWLSTPALAAAVSNAGGLGGLGMWGFPPRMRSGALPVSASRAAAA